MQGNTTFAQSQSDRFGLISNAGTFRKSGSSTGTISDGWTLNNTGIVQVQGGSLSLLSGSFISSGSLEVQPAATLNLSNGANIGGSFTVAAVGTVNFEGGTFDLSGVTLMNSGTINFPFFVTFRGN